MAAPNNSTITLRRCDSIMNESEWSDRLRSDPRNHELLLIYADWLEEQGDVRAENLRNNGVCPECVRRGVSVHDSARARSTEEQRETCIPCAIATFKMLIKNVNDSVPEIASLLRLFSRR